MTTTPPPTTLSTPSPTEHNAYEHDQDDLSAPKIPSSEELQAMNTFKQSKPLYLIVATSVKPPLGIGLKGQLPWPQIKADMSFFRKSTTGPNSQQSQSTPTKLNAVIMGRKTYESIPSKFRPLSNRVNVILTRSNVRNLADRILRDLTGPRDDEDSPPEYRLVDQATVAGLSAEVVSVFKRDHEQPTVVVTDSVRTAIETDAAELFCIGGAEIYSVVLGHLKSRHTETRILQTLVRKADGSDFECDIFWPGELSTEEGWREVGKEEVEQWVGTKLPQGDGDEGWLKDDKAEVEIQVVGWENTKK